MLSQLMARASYRSHIIYSLGEVYRGTRIKKISYSLTISGYYETCVVRPDKGLLHFRSINILGRSFLVIEFKGSLWACKGWTRHLLEGAILPRYPSNCPWPKWEEFYRALYMNWRIGRDDRDCKWTTAYVWYTGYRYSRCLVHIG